MYSEKLEPLTKMDMSCFELIIDWQGELSFIYDTSYESHYFTCDALTKLVRLFDNEEFRKFNEAHDRCADAFKDCADECARITPTRKNERTLIFINRLEDFERSIVARERAKILRDITHSMWVKSCESFITDEQISFDMLCEIGARLMHVDKYTLYM